MRMAKGHRLRVNLRALSITVITLGYSAIIHADHPSIGLGVSTAAPVLTKSATPLGSGEWVAGVQVEYNEFDPFSDGELIAFSNLYPWRLRFRC